MRSRIMGLAVLAAAAMANSARADVAYSIATSQVTNGSTTTLSVYLNETLTYGATTGGLSPTVINPNLSNQSQYDGGVGAVSLGFTVTNGAATITNLVNNSGLNGGAGQPTPNIQYNGTNTAAAIVEVGQATASTLSSTGTGTSQVVVSQVLLATLTVSGSGTISIGNAFAGSAAAQQYNGPAPTILSAYDDYDLTHNANPSGASFGSLTQAGYPDPVTGAYDNTSAYLVTVPATATPEPSSMALCGLAVCSMGLGYWRRRKASLAAEAAKLEEVRAV